MAGGTVSQECVERQCEKRLSIANLGDPSIRGRVDRLFCKVLLGELPNGVDNRRKVVKALVR